MSAIKSWTASDDLWAKVEPLIPKAKRPKGRKYHRRPGAGRKPMAPRRVFEGIMKGDVAAETAILSCRTLLD